MSVLLAALMLMASDPDGVVATAPRDGAALPSAVVAGEAPIPDDQAPVMRAGTQVQLSTAEQIDRFLAPARAADAEGRGRRVDPGLGWEDDGEMHGEVNVAVGSHGYTSYGGMISTPLGENGRFTFRFQESDGGRGYWGRPYWGGDPRFDPYLP